MMKPQQPEAWAADGKSRRYFVTQLQVSINVSWELLMFTRDEREEMTGDSDEPVLARVSFFSDIEL